MTIGRWGRYSDIFIYIRVRSIIFGSKFQKSNTFGSMKSYRYLGGRGHYEIGLFFFFFFWGGGGGGVISIQFRAF